MRLWPHRVWWIQTWCRVRRRHKPIQRPWVVQRPYNGLQWYRTEYDWCPNCGTGKTRTVACDEPER